MNTNDTNNTQSGNETPLPIAKPSFRQIDQCIYALMNGNQTVAAVTSTEGAPDTLGTRVERLVKIYAGIKPLLGVLATLPIIPVTWRSALALFNGAVEAVAVGAGQISPDFKAGKDL